MKIRTSVLLAAVASSVVVVGVSAWTPAHAGTDVGTDCIVPQFPSSAVAGGDLPSCSEVDGLCIDYENPVGPSRAVHAGRALPAGAVIEPNDDCDSFPEECVVTVLLPRSGPARAVHVVAAASVPSGLFPGEIFHYSDCLEIPETGFDVAPVLLAGLAALGTGAVVIGLRRRII